MRYRWLLALCFVFWPACDDSDQTCGNGTCEEGESNATCPGDCPTQSPVCGNGTCETTETPTSCPADCGSGSGGSAGSGGAASSALITEACDRQCGCIEDVKGSESFDRAACVASCAAALPQYAPSAACLTCLRDASCDENAHCTRPCPFSETFDYWILLPGISPCTANAAIHSGTTTTVYRCEDGEGWVPAIITFEAGGPSDIGCCPTAFPYCCSGPSPQGPGGGCCSDPVSAGESCGDIPGPCVLGTEE